MSYLRELENVTPSVIAAIIEVTGVPQFSRGKRGGEKLWVVLKDSIPEENLYIIHHTDNFLNQGNVFTQVGSGKRKNHLLRGVIIDVVRKVIVADSFGFNPVIESNEIPEGQAKSATGQVLNLRSTRNEYYRGLPGVVLRVFLYNDNVYFSTYKSIDVFSTKSGYNNYKYRDAIEDNRKVFESFLEDETLSFGWHHSAISGVKEKYKFSPFVHYFMLMLGPYFGPSLTDPGLSSVAYLRTSDVRDLQENYIGSTNVANTFDRMPELSLFDLDEFLVDINEELSERNVPMYLRREEISRRVQTQLETKFLDMSQPISKVNAEKYLRRGFYDISNRLAGEFIMIYMYKDDHLIGTVRVDSENYTLRSILRGDSFNMTLRFFELLDHTRTSTNRYNFTPDGYSKVPWRKHPLERSLLVPGFYVNWLQRGATPPDSEFRRAIYESVKNIQQATLNMQLLQVILLGSPVDHESYQVYQAWVNLLFSLNLFERSIPEGVLSLFDLFDAFLNQIYWLYLVPEFWDSYKESEQGYRNSLYHFLVAVKNHKNTNKSVVIRELIVPKTSGKVLYHFMNILLEDFEPLINDFINDNFEEPEMEKYETRGEAFDAFVNDTKLLLDTTSAIAEK